ncbi:MAG: hypothetical protein QXU98_02775 [Candidatus Parvarchaeota archaeon]
MNPHKALNESNEKNSELARIGKELDDLSSRSKKRDESSIHDKITRISGEWMLYFHISIKGGERRGLNGDITDI